MEVQQKSSREYTAQLTEKLGNKKENLLRQMNMMLEHKMKVSQAVALVVLDGHYHGTSGRDGQSLQQDHGGSIIATYCFWFIKTLRIIPFLKKKALISTIYVDFGEFRMSIDTSNPWKL